MENIIYEYPLNERMRVFLRLEYLFNQLDHFANNASIWDCKNYCFTLVEAIEQLDRNDLRQEITKELEKQIKYLTSLYDSQSVDKSLLENTINDFKLKLETIKQKNWKLTKNFNNDELICAIKSKASVSNSACSFDSPVFYRWLNLETEDRNQKLNEWQAEIKPVKDSIAIILNIIRNGAGFISKKSTSGYYQQDLDLPQPCQIIRISMPKKAYPQVSGDKHRVNIRFYEYDDIDNKPKQLEDELDFELSCCTLF